VHRTDSRGQPVLDENFTLLFNAHHDTMEFVLPPLPSSRRWRVELETESGIPGKPELLVGAATRALAARSIVLLMEVAASRWVGKRQR
jgi:glycogen operon protein